VQRSDARIVRTRAIPGSYHYGLAHLTGGKAGYTSVTRNDAPGLE